MQTITNDTSSQSKTLIDKLLNKLEGINKPRRYFMIHILHLYLSMRGRYTFEGLSRYGSKNEKSYRLQFEKPFDYLEFNIALSQAHLSGNLILAFDPCYVPKSGKHTPNSGHFWSGCLGRAARGLEAGGLAAIDLDYHTAFHLEAVMTPDKQTLEAKGQTLVDHYAEVIVERAQSISRLSAYLVVDGYFAKQKFVDPVESKTQLHIVSKLRKDANLKYLYKGPKREGKGRPKKFDGKVNTKQIDKSKFECLHQDEQIRVYQATLWSVSLKRNIRVAYVEFITDKPQQNNRYALFFSTDLSLDALSIFKYYKARFQIEFLFRDAKQHTGLNHSQARSKNKIHFHVNASLTAVSVAKAAHYLNDKRKTKPYSMADIKTAYLNERMLNLFFTSFDIDPHLTKNKHAIDSILSYGSMAA